MTNGQDILSRVRATQEQRGLMAIQRLRQQAAERAAVRYWKPSEGDDFRLIVFRNFGSLPSASGQLPLIEGYDVQTGEHFRMPYHAHIRWAFEQLGMEQGPPAGTVLSILWTGMAQKGQQEVYSYAVDVLTETDIPEELRDQVQRLVQLARDEAAALVREREAN